jgi:hypothetical protein
MVSWLTSAAKARGMVSAVRWRGAPHEIAVLTKSFRRGSA